MPLNILETSDSRKEKIARSAAGIEGRMCKSRFLSGDENNVSQTTQTPNRHQRIRDLRKIFRSVREAAVLIILAVRSGVIEKIPENVLRWQNELGRKREERNQGFLGVSYMVGSLKQIEWRSGCLLVYNDINASVYPPFSTLLYYSPSSSFFPLFVVRSRFALISRLHPFLLDFPILPSPFFFVSSLSQLLSCMHERSRVQPSATRILNTHRIVGIINDVQ